MSSIRDLKKDINFALGDIIEAVCIWEEGSNNQNSQARKDIIDKAISVFDDLMGMVHQKEVAVPKAHFREIRIQLEQKTTELLEQFNKMAN